MSSNSNTDDRLERIRWEEGLSSEGAIEALLDVIDFLEEWLPEGIAYSEPGEIKALKGLRFFRRGVAQWLKHLVLGQRLDPECLFTGWKYCQGHAELDKNLRELCIALHPRTHLSDHFGSPNAIWFYAMGIELKNSLANAGFTGEPKLFSKNQIFNHNLDQLARISPSGEGCGIRLLKEPKQGAINFGEDPQTYLASLAAALASEDPSFDEDYFLGFQKTQARWTRKIRDCRHVQSFGLLPDGKIFVGGKGKKVPNVLKPRGFG